MEPIRSGRHMTFVAIFLVNAALSFALSLVVAYMVGPEAFGRYAVALSLSVVINTAVFEWLRLSTTRFYSERAEAERPEVRRTLDIAYAVSCALIVLVTAVLLAAGPDLGLPPALLTAAVALGLAVGLFDYRTALARARFLDRRYAALLFLRGCGAFVLAAGAAYLWGKPAYVLASSALAAVVTLALLREPGRLSFPGRLRPELLATFARYALPLIAASAVYQVLPLLNRAVLASRSGFAEAGYFSLASEVAVRLFQNLGSALDLALFQVAVRAEETEGASAGERQVGRNLSAITALVLPAAIGLWAVWPSFEALFVPAAFRGRVEPAMVLAIPAFAAYALVQYALNPVFQLRRRTLPVVAAALVALAVNGVLLLAWPGLSGAADVAAVQLASLAAAAATLLGVAVWSGARLPWRDLIFALAASCLMGAALLPLRHLSAPAPTLLLQTLAGAGFYAVLCFALDIAGARAAGSALLGRMRRGETVR